MSAHPYIKAVDLVSVEPCPITMWAWRGCCLEIFARAEHAVADCLAELDNAGIPLTKEATNPFQMQRLKALKNCLSTYSFGGHERLARRLIADWEVLCEDRNWLAHGTIGSTADGIVAHHISFDGKHRKTWTPRFQTRQQMQELLLKIESNQRHLSNQLGQIKKAAPTAKPLPAA